MVKNSSNEIKVLRDTFESDVAENANEYRSSFNADESELFPNKVSNPLHKYNSFNYIFTLACLTVDEMNFPAKLRVGSPKVTILRSGGSGVSKIPTIYDTNFDGGLSSAREYFINDVTFITNIAPYGKNMSNVQKIDFQVFEPNGLGTFVETIRQAAVKAGYRNYADAPFCLTIEFVGIDSNNKNINVTDDNNRNVKRVIPIQINKIDLSATQAGTNYNIQATATQDYAHRNSVRQIPNDITLTGFTVQDFLQKALQEEFNKIKKNKNKNYDNNPVGRDDMIINFPTLNQLTEQSKQTEFAGEQGATVDPNEQRTQLVGTGTPVISTPWSISYEQSQGDMNEIGKSLMNFVDNQFKNVLNSDDKKYYDAIKKIAKTTRIVNERYGELTFKAGSTVEDIITNVLLYSDYSKYLLQDSDSLGFKKWFKINTRVYYINDADIFKNTGAYPKLIVYDVIEHDVHESLFVKPNVKTNTTKLKNFVCKEYDYLFTGKNLDVLKFDIAINQINALLLPPDQAQSKQDPNRKSKKTNSIESEINDDEGDTNKDAIASGVSRSNRYYSPRRATMESVGELTTEQRLALEFHDMIMTGPVAGLLKCDLTILGDPYYILDSGLGNYQAQYDRDPITGSIKFVNKDGSADQIFRGIFIVLNFRTPIDYGSSGQMTFNDTGNQMNKNFVKMEMFSGVYKVETVTNSFQRGVFTQDLVLTRIPNQEIKDTSSNQTPSALVTSTEFIPPPTIDNTGA
jgi:hypothetical protein